MTEQQRAAMQAALKVIESLNDSPDRDCWLGMYDWLVKDLRAALAEPRCCCGEPTAIGVVHRRDGPCYMAEPEAEPVAWWDEKLGVFDEKQFDQLHPLYLHPPRRDWVSLTEDEIHDLNGIRCNKGLILNQFVRAVEQALKERNT